ncbi:MAG: dehypoxanthine futalosine cyclase [Firmicutes bacterium]|nr:dehypoxanthine futalosine cyclase [Bacillota bacterium]
MASPFPEVSEILDRAIAGHRLSLQEGALLLEKGDLLSVGLAAGRVRKLRHPGGVVTFVADRNINFSNVCTSGCRFCAFYRPAGHPEAYVLSYEAVHRKIAEAVEAGATQILMQGGLHPGLRLSWYVGLLKGIKDRFPVHIHSLSPPEIVHLAVLEAIPIPRILVLLREAGLDSLPGGGAEILADRVRRRISPRKIGWREWIGVMREAHRLEMRTTATMMFGHLETPRERILHLDRVRRLQDETGGFTAFIPWSFQPRHTALAGKVRQPASALDYLRTLAVSRLYLDNVPNLQVSWVTQGAKVAQVALAFGANDFGGTMLEENVVRAAGVTFRMGSAEIVESIRGAGFHPAQRDTNYRIIRYFHEKEGGGSHA